MATLWEKLTKKKPAEVLLEKTVFNPLDALIGDTVKVNTVDLVGSRLKIASIREVKRQQHLSVDYHLTCEDKEYCLKLNPSNDKKCDVLLLQKISECGYDKAFHEGLADEFVEGDATYWRVNDLKNPWEATTTTLTDFDHSGKVDKDEAVKGKLTYWDYWRETTDEANNKVLEFYFVEMDENGYFTFWVGTEIDPLRIEI